MSSASPRPRRRPRALPWLSALSLGAGMACAAMPDLSGVYWATEYHATIPIAGGGAPPLNEAGKAAWQANRAGLKDGSVEDPARKYCLPDGIPRLLATPYPFEIFQLPPGQVTFVHELNNQVHVALLDTPLPSAQKAALLPAYDGFTSAHYEGDTLVIEANGYNDQTFLDSSGLPHSPALTTTERIRRIGNRLEDVVTIHDPRYYTRDWQARFVYQRRSGMRLQEYICDETHRDISAVKGVKEVRAARERGEFP